MKHILSRFLVVFSLFVGFTLSAQAAPVKYNIDPTHSYALWRISHFGYSFPSGKWFANGTLMLDKAHPENSKVNVIINVADVDTGIPKLDENLRSKEFFDTTTYPTATFISQKIEVTGKDTAKVYGILTLHGISKPVILKVKMNKAGQNPITLKMTAGFSATTQLKRSDFGIKAYLPGLGDNVWIAIEVEANKA